MSAKRMKTIVFNNGKVHLYVLLPLSQPDIIEKSILSLECNIVGPNEKEEGYVVLENDKIWNDGKKDNLDEMSNIVKCILDELNNGVKDKLN